MPRRPAMRRIRLLAIGLTTLLGAGIARAQPGGVPPGAEPAPAGGETVLADSTIAVVADTTEALLPDSLREDAALVADGAAAADSVKTPRYFDPARLPVAIASIGFGLLVVGFVASAQRGRSFYVRRIAGLEAVEEAVGRATEMGRPILFSPGLDPMDEVATVAAMNILGEVSRRVAKYGVPILVPNRDPIVMTVAQEVVRDAFMSAGVPDRYREQDVYYTTQSQFGYAASVCGTMVREKPATNFFFGRFYAESLVIAETGNMTGAVQIAGTDGDAQLPFFITACDYTLIGEELYAGSVYLSREPLLLGALKAQDMGKAVVLVLIVVGSVLSLLGVSLPRIAN